MCPILRRAILLARALTAEFLLPAGSGSRHLCQVMPGMMIHCEVECHSAVRSREDVPFALLVSMIRDSVKVYAKDDEDTMDMEIVLAHSALISICMYVGH